MRRAVLVTNPAAGRRARLRLDAALATVGERFAVQMIVVRPGAAVRAAVATAVAAGPDVVIAQGGDGTVSAVAGALVGTGVPMGILPGGTANSLARALGIPLDIEGACANLLTEHVRRIDTAVVRAGRSRPRTMVLAASVGLHADTIGGTERGRKRRWGSWAYFATGVEQLLALQPFRVAIGTERLQLAAEVVSVAIANAAPPISIWAHGPADVREDDGLLDVTLVAARSSLEAIASALHLTRVARAGDAAHRDNVGTFSCRRLHLEADPPRRILVDGETAGRGPLDLECVPASLCVIAPGRPPPP